MSKGKKNKKSVGKYQEQEKNKISVPDEFDSGKEMEEEPLSENLTGGETLTVSGNEEASAEADYMDELMRSKKLENQPSLAEKSGQDERALIREQERLAREKRRKKRNKRRNIIIGAVVVVLAVGIWFIGWGYSLIFGTSTAASTVEIVVESGQTVVYAKLTSVKGNEITYTVAEAVETSEDEETGEGSTDSGMPSGNRGGDSAETTDGEAGSGDSELPEGFDSVPEGFDGSSMPESFDSDSLPEGFDGELPSDAADGNAPSETPDTEESDTDTQTQDTQSSSTGTIKAQSMTMASTETATSSGTMTAQVSSLTVSSADSYTVLSLGGMGGDRGGMDGNMGGGGMGGGDFSDFSSFDFSSFGDTTSGTVTSTVSDTFTYDNVTYQLTDETNTMQIPVGTDVTTRLGTVTTFARLAAGDCVALIMQEVDGEDVIMAVYIIG